jgi:hypothetical protein
VRPAASCPAPASRSRRRQRWTTSSWSPCSTSSRSPHLTTAAIGANTAKIPPGTGQAGTWNFNQGFHTAIDDSCQIYWNATGHSMANGKTGTYVEVYSGKRYGLGQFPTGEPPYYS